MEPPALKLSMVPTDSVEANRLAEIMELATLKYVAEKLPTVKVEAVPAATGAMRTWLLTNNGADTVPEKFALKGKVAFMITERDIIVECQSVCHGCQAGNISENLRNQNHLRHLRKASQKSISETYSWSHQKWDKSVMVRVVAAQKERVLHTQFN